MEDQSLNSNEGKRNKVTSQKSLLFYETKNGPKSEQNCKLTDHTALAKVDVTKDYKDCLLLKNGHMHDHFFKGLLKCHCLKEMHYLQDSCSHGERKQCICLKSNKHTIKNNMSLEKWFMKLRDNHTDALECNCIGCKRRVNVNFSPQIQTNADFSCPFQLLTVLVWFLGS